MSGRALPLLARVPLLAAAAEDAQPPDPGSDWAQLLYYCDADRSLPLPSPGKARVVLLGDSITQSWDFADVQLPGVEVLNRGISGQTTPQMLVRFRQDVVDLQPAARIVALNRWLRAYAQRRGLVYADYYSAVVDPHGGFKSTLADDGVHPNKAGYAVMSPLARESIEQALERH